MARHWLIWSTPTGSALFVVLNEHSLAYGRIPKAANSSIKLALYRIVAGDTGHRKGVTKDEFWRGGAVAGADLLTASGLRQRHPDAFVFSFTRNPYSRLASCYFNKIILRHRVPRLYRYQGFSKDMGFAEFVEKAAAIDDDAIDIHACSQTHILGLDRGIEPSFTGRIENMKQDWQRLNTLLGDNGKPQLGKLKKLNRTADKRPPDSEMYSDPGLIRLVQTRYKDDFDNFYSDADTPA